MTDLGTFSRRQWALAAGLALTLHGLLAWAWLAATPPLAPASGGQGGLRVGTLSLGAAEAPLVTALAPEAPTRAAPLPPAVTAMTEVAPAPRPAPHPATPPPRPTETQTVEPAQPKKPPQTPARPRAEETRSAQPRTAQQRDDQGGRSGGDSGHQGAVGADREAGPLPGNPRPVYPILARRQGVEGRVMIRVAVLDSGRVGTAEVAHGSGARALDEAALAAVRRWRFHPALRNGQAIAATLTVPVIFRLED